MPNSDCSSDVGSYDLLIASTPDSPGPVIHRRNAMFICILLVFITTFITKYLNPYPIFITLELLILCFLYAMMAVFGPRAADVGTAGMLMIVLRSEEHTSELQSLMRSSYAVFCLKKK